LPDLAGSNVCIAGHRTTYGAWFRHVDKLEEGDEILLDYDGTSYAYQVEKVFIVAKNDWSITEAVGYSALTLTSCHPLRSSKQRIVVRAKLME
jgi:sortase A